MGDVAVWVHIQMPIPGNVVAGGVAINHTKCPSVSVRDVEVETLWQGVREFPIPGKPGLSVTRPGVVKYPIIRIDPTPACVFDICVMVSPEVPDSSTSTLDPIRVSKLKGELPNISRGHKGRLR